MQVDIAGHHLEVTPSLREYAESKLARLERHFDRVTRVHVVLKVEKQRHTAEATVHVGGADLFAAAEDGDMYAAIDALADKLDRQIKKHKEKKGDHHAREGAARRQG